ncbi:MAG TPA: nuclear transport factor 2 family protein [Streptosporangiaceae bacterium]|jgi:hypothetical protein|nr:nuclear transport factor 2 family protein [Streptosporangiaceae bacterium]
MQDTIERYIESWNQTDPQARRDQIAELWAADASYTDPMAQAHGHDEIDKLVAGAQAQFPGLTFHLIGPVDAHHQQARFTWGLGPAGAEPLVIGFDVAVAGQDGRLTSVLGFLDKVPA